MLLNSLTIFLSLAIVASATSNYDTNYYQQLQQLYAANSQNIPNNYNYNSAFAEGDSSYLAEALEQVNVPVCTLTSTVWVYIHDNITKTATLVGPTATATETAYTTVPSSSSSSQGSDATVTVTQIKTQIRPRTIPFLTTLTTISTLTTTKVIIPRVETYTVTVTPHGGHIKTLTITTTVTEDDQSSNIPVVSSTATPSSSTLSTTPSSSSGADNVVTTTVTRCPYLKSLTITVYTTETIYGLNTHTQ